MLMVGETEQRARFARALQEAMEARKTSARQLAIRLEIDPRRVARWLQEKDLPNLYEAAALAQALRVDESLFREPPEVPPPPPKPYYPIEKYLIGASVEGAVKSGEVEGRRRAQVPSDPVPPVQSPARRLRAAGSGRG